MESIAQPFTCVNGVSMYTYEKYERACRIGLQQARSFML